MEDFHNTSSFRRLFHASKNIRAIIRKQLKIYYPNWKRLTKKEKKNIAKKVLNEGNCSGCLGCRLLVKD